MQVDEKQLALRRVFDFDLEGTGRPHIEQFEVLAILIPIQHHRMVAIRVLAAVLALHREEIVL